MKVASFDSALRELVFSAQASSFDLPHQIPREDDRPRRVPRCIPIPDAERRSVHKVPELAKDSPEHVVKASVHKGWHRHRRRFPGEGMGLLNQLINRDYLEYTSASI